jgi:uncharacterized membrane protein YqiK
MAVAILGNKIFLHASQLHNSVRIRMDKAYSPMRLHARFSVGHRTEKGGASFTLYLFCLYKPGCCCVTERKKKARRHQAASASHRARTQPRRQAAAAQAEKEEALQNASPTYARRRKEDWRCQAASITKKKDAARLLSHGGGQRRAKRRQAAAHTYGRLSGAHLLRRYGKILRCRRDADTPS